MMIALILATILIGLSGLHIFWAFGGRWGSGAVVPTRADSSDAEGNAAKLFTPPFLATLAVAMALLIAALLVLWHAGFLALPLPTWMSRAGVWALAIVFALRAMGEFRYVGFFKRVRGTAFARMDTLLYSPLCLVIALLALIVVW